MADDAEGDDADGGEDAPGTTADDGTGRTVGDITIEAAAPGATHRYLMAGAKFMLTGILVVLAFLIIRFPLMVFINALGGLPSIFQGVVAAITLLFLILFFIIFSGWAVHTMWEWE